MLQSMGRKESDTTERLNNNNVVVILQYIHMSSHYGVYLKLTQCYMSSISQ